MAIYDTLMSISNIASSAKSTYAAAKTIASNSQPLPEEDKEKNADIAYIKEHGFTTYVKELEERKIEEMRRKILQSMGLDEESLAKMGATERQAIEKTIADAIEEKLNGATLANKQNNDEETPSERRDRMQAEIAFNPNMFDVFTALQSELSDGSVQSITADDEKKQDNAA
ncbi:hypothetical protein [Thalassospira xiamenensis]|uniref:Uncharacterized protein n=1 Tax=Thalassospira xiamenensis TaxID=220697 RepID=A0A367WU13_9PROT|nr:hypothetical protein [Thalassospira xiamenensis]KZB57022.1 hypothetical protein AUP41_12660 [Thalassospira xiamenensis]RCK44867.1 hypothetical protein TH44_22145 [Thalassospira xiamenensis]